MARTTQHRSHAPQPRSRGEHAVGRRVAAAAVTGLLGAGAVLYALPRTIEAAVEWGQDQDDATANAAPHSEDDVCTVVGKGTAPGEVSTRKLGDRYRNGSGPIHEFAADASLVHQASGEKGIGVCHDPEDPRGNYVVNPANIDPNQYESRQQFDAEVPEE